MRQYEYSPGQFGTGFSFVQPVQTAPGLEKEQARATREIERIMNFERQQADEFDRITSNMSGEAMQAFGKLSKTFGEQLNNLSEKLEENREADELYNSLFGGGLSPAEDAKETEVDAAALQVATVNADTAVRVESQTGNPALGQMAYGMDGGLGQAFVQSKTNLTQARTLYSPFMAAWLGSNKRINIGGQEMTVAEAALSGNPALVSAAMTAGRQQFLRTYGLGTTSKRELIKTLGPTILNTDASLSASAVANGIKTQRDIKISELTNLGYQLGSTPSTDQQADFTRLSELFYTSPTGMTRGQANEAAVKALVAGLKDKGDVEGLRALLGVSKIPGQKGTELGREYGHIINPAIREAARIDKQNDGIVQEDIESKMYKDLAGASSLSQKRQIIELAARSLEAKGLNKQARELRENMSDLEVAGNADYNTSILQSQIASGELTSPTAVQQAYLRGDISKEQRDELTGQLSSVIDFSKPKDEGAKTLASDWAKKATSDVFIGLGLKTDPTGQVVAIEGAGITPGDGQLLKGQIQRETNAVANRVIRENPGLSGPALNTKIQEALTIWYSENVASEQGKYYLPPELRTQKDVTGKDFIKKREQAGENIMNNTLLKPVTFSTPDRATGAPRTFMWNNGNQRGLSTQDIQLFNPLRGDKVFTSTAVQAYAEQYNKDGTFDPNLVAAAAALPQVGSPLALLQQQLNAHGMRVDLTGPARPVSATAPLTSVQGAQALMRMGFPAKGAAWLSGNIQTESSWLPNRSPWDDVGAPAGGLVSWRAGRLKNLEAAVGPVEQATTEAQLEYMLREMRSKYPEAYRIFMNPYATDRQLIRASKLYWGYGEEGARYTYAREIESQL